MSARTIAICTIIAAWPMLLLLGELIERVEGLV
jgi:hypothetical protein